MNYDKMTIMVQKAIQSGANLALSNNNTQVDVEHFLAASLDEQDCIASPLFDAIGVGAARVKNEVNQLIKSKPKVVGEMNSNPTISVELGKVLLNAEKEMSSMNDEYISTEHVILAEIKSNNSLAKALQKLGITEDNIKLALKQIRGNQRVTSDDPEAQFKALEKYTRQKR